MPTKFHIKISNSKEIRLRVTLGHINMHSMSHMRYLRVHTNVCGCMGLSFAPELYCCLDFDWLPPCPPPILPLWFSTRSNCSFHPCLRAGKRPPLCPTICLLWPNFGTFDMSSCLHHTNLQHAAGLSLKVHVTYGETYTSSKSIHCS